MTEQGHFPPAIAALGAFDGPFDAYSLAADRCEVLFASYPAGTNIPPHSHATSNVGVITKGSLILTTNDSEQSFGVGEWYQVPAGVEHAARFDVESAEIEFWFQPVPTASPTSG